MSKTDRCVVRNEAYKRDALNIRERHNERKNEEYQNPDIIPERAALNVHFKRCEGTYAEAFDQREKDGIISTRGLKADANIVDEMIFDVNTAYFERNGGYDYAKAFFEEAYRCAVNEIGGEQYVLSAVMHADERNKGLSEDLGYDVYHYHLHVVYVPIVQKEVKWTKRCKDPALVGTVKEVINQVSHSKRWGIEKGVDENGKKTVKSVYSQLQDSYFEHMQAAGYVGFERGVRGSTAEHLSNLEYKAQQEAARLEGLEKTILQKENQAASLDKKVDTKQKQLSSVEKQLDTAKTNAYMFDEIDGMAKKTLLGKIELTPANWQEVSTLAKNGITAKTEVKQLKEKLTAAQNETNEYKRRYNQLLENTRDFIKAIKLSPQKVKDFIANTLTQEKQQPQQPQIIPEIKRKRTVNEL